MDEERSSEEPSATSRTPGEVRPRRQLDRAPSERFGPQPGPPVPDAPRGPAPTVRTPRAGVPLALGIATIGAVAVVVLYGVVATTFGLLAIAGTTGFLVGVALRGAAGPAGLAVVLSVGAMVIGIVGGWAVSIAEGGIAGPIDYVGQTLGPLALLIPIVGGLGAWLGGRR